MKLKTLNQAVLATMLTATTAFANDQIKSEPAVTWGGFVNVSTSQFENDEVVLAIDEIELELNAKISSNISATLILNDKNLGTANHTGIGGIGSPVVATINTTTSYGEFVVGKMISPFSSLDTFMAYDSVTYEQIPGSGIAFANNAGNLDYTVYAMAPDNDYTQTGDNSFADLAGLNLSYSFNQYSAIDAGVVSVDGNRSTAIAYKGEAAGLGFIAQYTNKSGETEPRTNLEVSYAVGYGAFAISKQSDASNKDIWLYGFSAELTKDLGAKLEYKENLNDKETTFTAQLAYNF